MRRALAPPDTEVTMVEQTLAQAGVAQEIGLPGTDRPAVYVVEHPVDDRWPHSILCRPPLCPLALRTATSPMVDLYVADGQVGQRSTPIAPQILTFPMTVYVGNSPDPYYAAGGYTLSALGEVAGPVRITRLSRPTPPDPTLNLNLFYAGAAVAPEGTRGPPAIAAALAEVERILAQAGIKLGKILQLRVPGELLQQGNTFEGADPRAGFAVLKAGYGVWPELPALFFLSAGASNVGVNVFLVADIAGMGEGEIHAISGGTPGPMGMHGTGASGIAVATDMLLGRPEVLGRTLAHELGHYLGLFHVIEADGSSLDPLPDTPRCPRDHDRNGDGLLSSAECMDQGADNLMFWSQAPGTELTKTQSVILRRALLL